MDSGKEINILMILFITFIAGLASGMALPDGIIQIIIGLILGIIVLGLCLKSLMEHVQAHDQRVIEMTDMAHYAASIYGNQEKQKQEKQDDDETELEDVSPGTKARILAKIRRQREQSLDLEINN